MTAHPTAQWLANQMREAFPFDTAPRYLIRDRDGVCGEEFRRAVKSMGIEEVVIAPQSPWQNPYMERLIGTLRRELLDHIIVLNQAHLGRLLKAFFTYYHQGRCHMALDNNSPIPRQVQASEHGAMIGVPHLGGLHHVYRRVA